MRALTFISLIGYDLLPDILRRLIDPALPRDFHRRYAGRRKLFWLPCPVCGESFGAHEKSDTGLITKTGKQVGYPLKAGESMSFYMYDDRFNNGTYTFDELLAHPNVIKLKAQAVCRKCSGEARRRNRPTLERLGVEPAAVEGCQNP